MRVTVVGAGYVGLVTGACLARHGHEVTCVDVDPERVDAINRGQAPFHEPGLSELVAEVVGRRLGATTDLAGSVRTSELTLIAVGTPFRNGSIDLEAVRGAANAIGAALNGGTEFHTVVVRSTVVPGTTERVVGPLLEAASGRRIGRDLGLGANPEFLTEGTAIADFEQQDRIVLGTGDARSLEALEQLYASMPGVPRVRVNPRTAELIKYASNALLATAISFSNELADLAEAVGGIDVADVTRGVHLSRYLTSREGTTPWTAPLAGYLEAGCGYGGSCLPKDVRALAAQGQALGLDMQLLRAVHAVNLGRPDRLLAHLRRHLPDLAGRRITVLGFAFKPFTDDVRETPARPVIDVLLSAGAKVTIHDPAAGAQARREYGDRTVVAPDLESAVRDAEALVLVTRWPDYEALPELLAGRPDPPLLVDGRRMIDRGRIARYEGIGWSEPA